MMKMKRRILAQATVVALSAIAHPLWAAQCLNDNATPMNVGAAAVEGPTGIKYAGLTATPFARYVQDSEGVALSICVDQEFPGDTRFVKEQFPGDLNAIPLCFFDPVVAGNPLSEASQFGGEGFWFLADSLIDTTATGIVRTTPAISPIDARLVMGVEAAYLSADGNPQAGTEFSFQRLRIRITVAEPGKYVIEYPWGVRTYLVDQVYQVDRVTGLPVLDLAGNPVLDKWQINETIDTGFSTGGVGRGKIAPFLKWSASPPVPGQRVRTPGAELPPPAGYIGNGPGYPGFVTGSPCGVNWIRITANRFDGSPIPINNQAATMPASGWVEGQDNVITEYEFAVMGKEVTGIAPPLTVRGATYSRSADGGSVRVNVFANAPTTATLTATAGAVPIPLASTSGRTFGSQTLAPNSGVPATVTVTAAIPPAPESTTIEVPVVDQVAITQATATPSGAGPSKTWTLTVTAESSDKVSGAANLSTNIPGVTFAPGATSVTVTGLRVVPTTVTVTSTKLGSATKPVTILN